MSTFKCSHCGGTEFGGFRFNVKDEEGNVYPVDVCVKCVAKIANKHGVFEMENALEVYNKVKDTVEIKGGCNDDPR